MKKKKLITLLIVCVLVVSLCIPQVNALAMDALSGFRVGQAKTITVTLDDITQMMSYAQQNAEAYSEGDFELPDGWEEYDHTDLADLEERDFTPRELDSVSDFTAFSVNLPRDLQDEPMELFAMDQVEQTLTLEDGSAVQVALSPMLFAAYEEKDIVFAATQGISDTLTREQKTELQEKVLALPFLTENLRSQLAEIDPDTKDIYLPVVPGISREASIGNTTGYLYGMNEVAGVASALYPEFAGEYSEADTEDLDNLNLLVWTKDGVLYLLGGDMPETELVAIARSVR